MSTSVPPPGFVPPQSSGPPAPGEPPGGLAAAARPVSVPRAVNTPSGRPKLLAGGGALLAVAAVLVFVLFGSGGSPLNDPVAQAATVSSSTPGYRVHMNINTRVDGLPFTTTADGVVDVPDHASSMSMTIDLSSIPEAAQALGGSGAMQMGMVLEGDTMYMKLPQALASRIPSLASKPWLKVDLSRLTGVPGVSSLMNNPAASDPTQVLRYLRAEADSVTNAGKQTVEGVETTHYRVELNPNRLPANLPAAAQARLHQALSSLEQTTQLQDIPADVWVDGHNLVRRVELTLDLHTPNGVGMQSTVSETITDYGPQARPASPPADQVQDVSNLVGANRSLTQGG